ncbi:MAG: hypothetical protein LOD90_06920 [Symbiobacteriaceae bacterium]|nr:MAG: hypothetical protein DIU69_08930 [Bacillota bacterium]
MKEPTWARRQIEVAYRLGKISSETYQRLVHEWETREEQRRQAVRARLALAVAHLGRQAAHSRSAGLGN